MLTQGETEPTIGSGDDNCFLHGGVIARGCFHYDPIQPEGSDQKKPPTRESLWRAVFETAIIQMAGGFKP
jgi:hypothetical protein